jgi:hypothetical protein
MYEVVSELIERLDVDLRELWDERAGIVEFDGGLPREEAESYALLDVLRRHPFALTGLAVIRVDREHETRWLVTSDPDAANRVTSSCGNAARIVEFIDVLNEQFGGAALLVQVPECSE